MIKGAHKLAALLAGAALLLSGCGAGNPTPANTASDSGTAQCKRNREAGTITYVSGYGYSASAGQLDVFLAKELGYFDELCLTVAINAAGGNGQQLVSAGQAQFTALGSASDVILAAANTDQLTAVATYADTSPFSIFANERIKSLGDLEGGTLGYFINLTPMARAMLDAAGVDISKVELVKMTNYDPTVVTRGQVDAIVGYASNQPESLRAQNLPFTEFLPADLQIQGTYNVMEVNTRFLKEHREVAADFMRASLKALNYCLDNSEECLDKLAALAKAAGQDGAFPRDQLGRTWAVESKWVRESKMGPPGVQTTEAWDKEIELVKKYEPTVKIRPLAEMMDTKLVSELYDGDKLIWPGE